MAMKGFSAEALNGKLREAEVLSGQGRTIDEICERLASRIRLTIGGANYGFSSAVPTGKTYNPGYGGMRTEQAQRLKELEKENQRWRKLVADLALDKVMRQETLPVKS